MAKRKLNFSLVALFDSRAAIRGLRRFSGRVVGTMRRMTRATGLGAGFATGARAWRPGGAGGILAGITQGAASLVTMPARILGGFARLIPGIGGILSGVVSTGANILQGLIGVAGNIVGGIVNVFGKLVSLVAGIFTRVVGAAVGILGKLPRVILLAGGAAAGASAGFMALVGSVAKAGDEIAKMAKRTGLATGFLSEMKHVLELNDATLQDLQMAMRGVGRAVEGASRGATEYAEIFDRLGVSYRDTNGRIKQSERLFMDLVYALGRVRNETLRLGLAQKLFGRSGSALIPLVEAGRKAIEQQRQEARELGLTWAGPAAAAAERYRDALTRVKNALRGLMQNFLIPFLEPFAARMERWSKWLARHKDDVRAWGESAAKAVEETIPKVLRWMAKIPEAVADVYAKIAETDWPEAWTNFKDNIKALPGFVGAQLGLLVSVCGKYLELAASYAAGIVDTMLGRFGEAVELGLAEIEARLARAARNQAIAEVIDLAAGDEKALLRLIPRMLKAKALLGVAKVPGGAARAVGGARAGAPERATARETREAELLEEIRDLLLGGKERAAETFKEPFPRRPAEAGGAAEAAMTGAAEVKAMPEYKRLEALVAQRLRMSELFERAGFMKLAVQAVEDAHEQDVLLKEAFRQTLEMFGQAGKERQEIKNTLRDYGREMRKLKRLSVARG